MSTTEDPQVFAQPWWLRCINVLAALCPPLLLLSLLAPGRSPALVTVMGVLFLGSGLLIGIRAALSHVVLTSSALDYRGTFRSHRVPVAALLALDDGDVGPLAVFTNRNGPALYWRDGAGSARRTTLACLPAIGPTRDHRSGHDPVGHRRPADHLGALLPPQPMSPADRCWTNG